jgi:hypothetical protein
VPRRPLAAARPPQVGRTKLLVFGGVRSEGSAVADVTLLNADTMKWMAPPLKVSGAEAASLSGSTQLRYSVPLCS